MWKRVARWLAGGIPTGLHLPILRGPLRGCWWMAGAGAGAGKGLSILLFPFDRREMEALDALVPRGSVAFDLGANVGLYSLLLSRRCRRVYAFEPVPRNLRYMQRILDANGVENVVVVPWAVSDRVEMEALREGENNALAALDHDGTQPALTVSCDRFVERYGVVPTVLKVDVEGAEGAVLRGARRLLAEVRPLVLLSTHSPALTEECLALMREAGYPEPRRMTEDPLNGGVTLLWIPGRAEESAAPPRQGAGARAGAAI